jgi:hypothetical protein
MRQGWAVPEKGMNELGREAIASCDFGLGVMTVDCWDLPYWV